MAELVEKSVLNLEDLSADEVEELHLDGFTSSEDESHVASVENIHGDNISSVEEHIYFHYTEKKQQQDLMFTVQYNRKLVMLGVADPTAVAMSNLKKYFGGDSISAIVGSIASPKREIFEKLLKVDIRGQWADACLTEFRLSVLENREAIYTAYPQL